MFLHLKHWRATICWVPAVKSVYKCKPRARKSSFLINMETIHGLCVWNKDDPYSYLIVPRFSKHPIKTVQTRYHTSPQLKETFIPWKCLFLTIKNIYLSLLELVFYWKSNKVIANTEIIFSKTRCPYRFTTATLLRAIHNITSRWSGSKYTKSSWSYCSWSKSNASLIQNTKKGEKESLTLHPFNPTALRMTKT